MNWNSLRIRKWHASFLFWMITRHVFCSIAVFGTHRGFHWLQWGWAHRGWSLKSRCVSKSWTKKNKIKPHLWGIFPSTKWETSCLQQSVCSTTTVWKYYWSPSAEMSSWRNWQSSFVIQNDYHSYVLSIPVIISRASGLGRGALYLYCGVFLKRILALCSASRNKVFIDHLLPLSDISLAGCGYKLKCKQKLALNQSWRDFAC